MNEVVGSPTFQFVECPAEIIQDLPIDEFQFAFRRRSMHQPWNAIDDQAQILFALAKSLLSALQIFNIGGNTIPANHATAAIPQGLSIRSKPAIDVIEPPHTLVYIARLAGLDRMQPCIFRFLNMLRMG